MLLKQHRHPKIAILSDGLGIPSMLKLHWLKSTFADKLASVIYNIFKRMAWLVSEQGVEARSGHGSPAIQGLVRATPADPSAVAARWAATSVPARNKTRQPLTGK